MLETNAVATEIKELLSSSDPTQSIADYFRQMPQDACSKITILGQSNDSEHKKILLQFLTNDFSIHELRLAGYRKNDFKELLDRQKVETRARILSVNDALWALHLSGYKKDDFEELLDEQDIKSRANILSASAAFWALQFSGYKKDDFEELLDEQDIKSRANILSASATIWVLMFSGYKKDDLKDVFRGQNKETIQNIIDNTYDKKFLLETLGVDNLNMWIDEIVDDTFFDLQLNPELDIFSCES